MNINGIKWKWNNNKEHLKVVWEGLINIKLMDMFRIPSQQMGLAKLDSHETLKIKLIGHSFQWDHCMWASLVEC